MGRMVLVPRGSFTLVLVIVPRFVGLSFLYKFLQHPFSYEFLYLLLQVSIIFYVVAMILVETAVFLLVMYIG